ncbi:uncharacterized protein LOC110727179 isoform X2 [Chenopodium quinoa]|nr:uncharacterized protein LOC110727179 isoform X2 [Chenopodium quinoa]
MLKREEILEVRPKQYPICGCGAVVCGFLKENGHSYFICPIKKAYGACNFRQLMEEDQESFSPEAIMQIDDVVNLSLARRALDFFSEEVQVQMENGVGGSSGIAHGMSQRSSDALHSVENNLNMGDTLVNNVEASAPTTIIPAEIQFSPDNTPSKGGFKSDELLPKQTVLMKDGRNEDHVVTDAVLQASGKLSKFSLNELITLLESVGSKNHKKGMMECYTFAGLDCLQLDDNRLLHLLLIEYIPQAAALSFIEQDINYDISMKFLDHNKNREARFKEIFRAFCEAGKAYMASNERLNSIRENFSCGGIMLDDWEDELWCCEVENDSERDKFLQITKTMSQCMQGELAGCV